MAVPNDFPSMAKVTTASGAKPVAVNVTAALGPVEGVGVVSNGVAGG
jgi:hypothetical protein